MSTEIYKLPACLLASHGYGRHFEGQAYWKFEQSGQSVRPWDIHPDWATTVRAAKLVTLHRLMRARLPDSLTSESFGPVVNVKLSPDDDQTKDVLLADKRKPFPSSQPTPRASTAG